MSYSYNYDSDSAWWYNYDVDIDFTPEELANMTPVSTTESILTILSVLAFIVCLFLLNKCECQKTRQDDDYHYV